MYDHDQLSLATTAAISCAILIVALSISREAGWNVTPVKYVFVPLVLAVVASMLTNESPSASVGPADALAVAQVASAASTTNAVKVAKAAEALAVAQTASPLPLPQGANNVPLTADASTVLQSTVRHALSSMVKYLPGLDANMVLFGFTPPLDEWAGLEPAQLRDAYNQACETVLHAVGRTSDRGVQLMCSALRGANEVTLRYMHGMAPYGEQLDDPESSDVIKRGPRNTYTVINTHSADANKNDLSNNCWLDSVLVALLGSDTMMRRLLIDPTINYGFEPWQLTEKQGSYTSMQARLKQQLMALFEYMKVDTSADNPLKGTYADLSTADQTNAPVANSIRKIMSAWPHGEFATNLPCEPNGALNTVFEALCPVAFGCYERRGTYYANLTQGDHCADPTKIDFQLQWKDSSIVPIQPGQRLRDALSPYTEGRADDGFNPVDFKPCKYTTKISERFRGAQHAIIGMYPRLKYDNSLDNAKLDVEETLDLPVVDSKTKESAVVRYRLTAMVLYKGAHYTTVFLNNGRWYLFDDIPTPTNITALGAGPLHQLPRFNAYRRQAVQFHYHRADLYPASVAAQRRGLT